MWKVGQLARQCGLTVRALHHYESLGLLTPTMVSARGHRLYGAADLARLQKIVSLRALGLALNDIKRILDEGQMSAADIVRAQLERTDRQFEETRRLRERLSGLLRSLESGQGPSTEALMAAIEEMVKVEKYYTKEQLQELHERGQAMGDGAMRQAERDWAELMEAVEAEMAAGTDPQHPRVRELARRWQALIEAFTGGNPGIRESLSRMLQNEDSIHGIQTAKVRDMSAYIQAAMAQ